MITENATLEQIQTLLLLRHIFAGLSFVGCVIIIVRFIRSKIPTSDTGKLIICLVLSSLALSVSDLVPMFSNDYYQWCNIDGPLRASAILSSFYWATMISLIAFRALVSQEFDPNQPTRIFVLGFGVPIVIASIPIFCQEFLKYQNRGLNCDISSNKPEWETIWQIVFVVGPMLIGFVLTTYYSIKVVRYLRGFEISLGISTSNFLAHPMGLLIIWTPVILFKIIHLCGGYIYVLDVFSVIFSSSAGLINAILYGWQIFRAAKAAKDEAFMNENPKSSMLTASFLQGL